MSKYRAGLARNIAWRHHLTHVLATLILLLHYAAIVSTASSKNTPIDGTACQPVYVRWPRVRLNLASLRTSSKTLQSCKNACTKDEEPEGAATPHYHCSAFNHREGTTPYTHECQPFPRDNVQHTDGYVEADERYSFYWKYCVRCTSNRQCPGNYHFTFHSDRYMLPQDVQASVYTSSLEDCLAECMNSAERRKGLLCASVSFNRTDGGCHLSEHNQLSKPSSLRINNNPNFRVDYYENECIRKKESFRFHSNCEPGGVRVEVESKFPYTGALYGLYDFFSCRVEPKEAKQFSYLFPYPTLSKNCSDSMRYNGNEVTLEVVLSTDGVEPLYFITSDDLTYQVKCPLPGKQYASGDQRFSTTATKEFDSDQLGSSQSSSSSMAAKEPPNTTTSSVPTTYTGASSVGATSTTVHHSDPSSVLVGRDLTPSSTSAASKITTKDVFTLPLLTTKPGPHTTPTPSTSTSTIFTTSTSAYSSGTNEPLNKKSLTRQPADLLLSDDRAATATKVSTQLPKHHHGLEPIDLSELKFRDPALSTLTTSTNTTASIEEVEQRNDPQGKTPPLPDAANGNNFSFKTRLTFPYGDGIAISTSGGSAPKLGNDDKTGRESASTERQSPALTTTPVTSTTTTTTTTPATPHTSTPPAPSSTTPKSSTPGSSLAHSATANNNTALPAGIKRPPARSNESETAGGQHHERRTNDAVIFDIFHNGQPADAVEPIGSLYEWEKEPLAIIKDGCQADHVGLVCPPQRTEYGIRVSVEAFRYQTTTQVQYTCLVRVCPFAPCPQTTCGAVEGCLADDLVSRSLGLGRAKRHLSVEQIRAALAANPYLQQQLSLSQSSSANARMNISLQTQLISIGGDHIVRKRLIVVNTEEDLHYYIRTGEAPKGHL